jgi:hypothetical protein
VSVEDLRGTLNLLLESQKKMLSALKDHKDRLDKLEVKVGQGVAGKGKTETRVRLPRSLLRTLKAMSELKRPVGADELARDMKLSRNLTSAYLAKLYEASYVSKRTNMELHRRTRYLFEINEKGLPSNIRQWLWQPLHVEVVAKPAATPRQAPVIDLIEEEEQQDGALLA